jgi:putative membrane protein insertion efficiency factor
MGAAVERNRAKRLVRELFRHNKPAAAPTSSSCRAASADASFDRTRRIPVALSKRAARSPPSGVRQKKSRRMLSRVALALIRVYKISFSPLFAGSCRYTPGCADYMSESIARFGFVRGGWIGTKRLCRCHPFGGHGFDPVPTQK